MRSAASPRSTSQATRSPSARVLPVPAPPSSRSGPPSCRIAASSGSGVDSTFERIGPMNALAADWLGACRRTVEGMREMFGEHATTEQRAVYTGERGEGGDRTLVIDEVAEQAAFAQLDDIHAAGHRFVAVSEERGEVDYG